MKNKKIFIFLPDGVGLRNFVFSNLPTIVKKGNIDISYWNNTPFSLNKLGFDEIKIKNSKTHILTDLFKNARKHIELNLSFKKTNDTVYNSYRFPFLFDSFKNVVKSILTKIIIYVYSTEKGLVSVRNKIKNNERKTLYYKSSLKTLLKERPVMLLCTNQRPILAVAPILAAQDLGIPTATFIFSWDNLPKATMVVETDYYFVWSDYMKQEVMKYYPYINPSQIFITGTPQFESHFDENIVLSREDFFRENGLDLNKKYICFSGDDVTSSPDDPKYLQDLAESILLCNKEGLNLGVIFRRCPVDVSGRYKEIVEKYKEIIVEIAPKWLNMGGSWDLILPTKDDNSLLVNTIAHTEMVVNLGSSMVFDYVALQKPCAYFNYNQKTKINKLWDINTCYNYIHFRSIPSNEAVVWLNNKEEIPNKIKKTLNNSETTVKYAKEWFEIINIENPKQASEKILKAINQIIN